MPRKKFGRNRKNRCRFCTRDGCPRPAYVDYKDIGLAQEAVHQPEQDVFSQAQRKLRGLSTSRQLRCQAARFMALMPYVGE